MGADCVVVTGASGYLAGHCVLQLLARGYHVRGTLRSAKRAGEVRQWLARARGADPGDALSFVEAELTEPAGWKAAMEGARYVLHTASPIPPTQPKDPDMLIRPAREGTLHVMRAASAATVQRVVQTSSAVAIMYGCDDPNGRVFTEETWSNPDHHDNSPYSRSKTLAEQAAWAELPKLARPIEWVAIQPGLILGPVLARDASATVQIIDMLMKGELPGLPRFAYSVVDVRDLADLHIRAMLNPHAAGQRYLGTSSFVSMPDMARILKNGLGAEAKKVPTRGLPDWLVRIVGLFDPAVRGQLFELGKERRGSSQKAISQLGWATRPVEQTILDTATSLAAVGGLERK